MESKQKKRPIGRFFVWSISQLDFQQSVGKSLTECLLLR